MRAQQQNNGNCVEERKYYVYKDLENKHMFIENFWLFVEHSLTTPGTNIARQKIFYFTNIDG